MLKYTANYKHYNLLRNILFEFNEKLIDKHTIPENYSLLNELNIKITFKFDEMLRDLLNKVYINLNTIPNNSFKFPPILQLCLCDSKYTEKMLEILLEYGADPNIQIGHNKLSPLHLAILLKNKRIIKILLEHNANVHISMKNYITPIIYTEYLLKIEPSNNDLLEIKKLLLYYGAIYSNL